MLKEIRIRNFAIVEDCTLRFSDGMTAFTGETGAGKSLLFDAVTLLLGAKAPFRGVRNGAASAEVEGVLDLSKDAHRRETANELGFETEADEGHLLVIRREIAASGEASRNRVWIQGKAATRSQLNSLLGDWVEISGQHEFLKLNREAHLLSLIDTFGGLEAEADAYRDIWNEWRHAGEELEALEQAGGSRNERLDYLRFQVSELEKAGVSAELSQEEEKLTLKQRELANRERVTQSLALVREALDGDSAEGALPLVQRALRELRLLESIGEDYANLVTLLQEAEALLEEASSRTGRLSAAVDGEPEALESLEARLSQIQKLKRKYGCGADELGARLEDLRQELTRLESLEDNIARLKAEADKALALAETAARKLHKRRTEAATELAERWQKDIRQLGMKKARIDLQTEVGELAASGHTRVSALFSGNEGETPRTLGKVASGGELSRILLALKNVIAGRSEIAVYLFDEVDAGIGGETAHAVADRLRSISRNNQVLVVTHLPQVAATADTQVRIRKFTEKGRTRTVAEKVERDERLDELARMLGASGSQTARKLAKELLGRTAG